MPAAEIIAIGTELLLGEIQDTNTHYLARTLRNYGIDIFRTTIVGDNQYRVAETIKECMERGEIIITTGGLGPTVDDPTREAVALAVNTELEFRPELWAQIENRFARFQRIPTKNNKKQAYIPFGSIPVENPVGTAPSFIVDTGKNVIISLPGVPREMEYLTIHEMIPYLVKRFELKGIIKARVLHTSGIGESQVDEWIGDLEKSTNPTVGLLAHAGQVDIRITAKAENEIIADELIDGMDATIRERLGGHIFGIDKETLQSALTRIIHQSNAKFLLLINENETLLWQTFTSMSAEHDNMQVKTHTITSVDSMKTYMKEQIHNHHHEMLSGIIYSPDTSVQTIHCIFMSETNTHAVSRYFGGPPSMGPRWAVNTFYDFLRRQFLKETNEIS